MTEMNILKLNKYDRESLHLESLDYPNNIVLYFIIVIIFYIMYYTRFKD